MKLGKKYIRSSSNMINIIKGMVVGGLILALIYVNMTRPRVLVLHSYSEDFPWVADFDTSFRNSFKHPSNPLVYYSYMNTLKHQDTRDKARSGKESMKMIDSIRPDIIISVFIDANEFVAQNYINHPKIQIIYNMKGNPAKYQYDTAKNTQGIKAEPALNELNTLLLLANPKRPLRIAHIGDQSAGVPLYDTYLTTHKWDNLVLVDSILVPNFPQWKESVKALAAQVDYLIISKYGGLTETTDPTSNPVPKKDIMKWTMQNCKVPVIGLYTNIVDDGGDVGIEDSPFEQGEIIAKMAMKLLGKQPVNPKMQGTTHFISAINPTTNIKLPDVYNSFSMALKQARKFHDL